VSSLTRVALPIVIVVALAAGGWFVFHKSPQTISTAPGKHTAAMRSHTIVVPDVRAQTFVVAKSALESAGLAWTVVGGVKGYHANVVVAQTPRPGTRLIDTGAPLIRLRLKKAGTQVGAPQQHSAVAGTQVEVRGAPSSGVAAAATPETMTTTPAPTTTAKAPAATTTATTPVAKPRTTHTPAKAAPAKTTPPKTTKPATPVRRTKTTARPAHRTKAPRPHVTIAARKPAAPVAAASTTEKLPFSNRPPAFLLPGNANRERAGELPLPVRADKLMRFVHAHKKPTNAAVKHWLVQHAWIAAGARFGWWHGADALQTLIATDRLVEAQWGIGYRSEAVARAALAYVHAHEVTR
jgi:hypothetical protein